MYLGEVITKDERKKYIKSIEYHLRNYSNYKVAVKNLNNQLEFISSTEHKAISDSNTVFRSNLYHSKFKIFRDKLFQNELIINAIEGSLIELNEVELQFIKYRYFKSYSIDKVAIKIGYSDKAIFTVRSQVMDKLLISLSIIYL